MKFYTNYDMSTDNYYFNIDNSNQNLEMNIMIKTPLSTSTSINKFTEKTLEVNLFYN